MTIEQRAERFQNGFLVVLMALLAFWPVTLIVGLILWAYVR